ncbi:phytanoyl-CoA dioxygenase [Mucilaginibacter hurinus]|uniref:Phytanoyl-CoA dioxygenase n=1 Tax=Mucilaginibacter hurinus TaxID=2201324 RepID=A0A367GRU4_9SPHI|nr:phytanoyl-CoA dioxygenase family protein [Mucilaginibacter hurinus]RCH56169.1 phytanoyl-CoA dioxygenase [Mucilaginibacter hurinus]
MGMHLYNGEVVKNGFAIINNIYSAAEVSAITNILSSVQATNGNYRKTADLFAIRRFFKEVPEVAAPIFNDKLKQVIEECLGCGYFVVKSIYFDKPGNSNWFVAYHQDLTISVDKKIEASGYGPWTIKGKHFGVQPPLAVLEDNYTIRIHLDETDASNGALKVIPGSHTKGIYRPETIDWSVEQEVTCAVEAGGVMIMKPLLLHSSGRTVNKQSRRVIHIEFSRTALPAGLGWAEY